MTPLILGERGFLGSALLKRLGSQMPSDVWINCAAKCMGIEGNRLGPATMIHANLAIALEVFAKAPLNGVKRVVNFGSTCAYSPESPTPFEPKDYLKGDPEPTNGPYAIAKRAIYSLSRSYSEQHGMDNLYLVMPNLYGPGDHFKAFAHVIPDIIKKVDAAQKASVKFIELFGTGAPEREFLYIDDAVDLILKAVVDVHTQDPVHLTSGEMITIKDLADLILKEMGFDGYIHWRSDKPDGQLKRQLARGMQLEKPTTIVEGIRKTVEWYRSQQIAA